ncbi:MAG: hypothetical protein ACYC35_10500 [Pirellulales bacterium]
MMASWVLMAACGLAAAAEPAGEPEALARIAGRMREVEALMGEAKSGQPTQSLQAEIVSDLDKLIQAACRRGGQAGAGAAKPQASPGKGSAKPPKIQDQGPSGKSKGGPGAGDAPQAKSPARVDMRQMQGLIKQLWGHLPPKAREQVSQSSVEQFLPKYELLIEQYFKTLAEQQREQP